MLLVLGFFPVTFLCGQELFKACRSGAPIRRQKSYLMPAESELHDHYYLGVFESK